MRNRPAVKIIIPIAIGIMGGYFYNFDIVPVFIVLGAISIFCIIGFRNNKPKLFDMVVVAGLFLLGALRVELATDNYSPLDISSFTALDGLVGVEGRVVRAPEVRPDYFNLIVNADSVFIPPLSKFVLKAGLVDFLKKKGIVDHTPLSNSLPATGKILVKVRDLPNLYSYGERIRFRGRLEEPQGPRNPGEFNYCKYLKSRGIRAVVVINRNRDLLKVGEGNGSWILRDFVYPLRSFITDCVDRTIPGQEGALLKGLLVGARGEIDRDLRDSFAKVGVVHVLAVSGLHVGFVVLFAMILLRAFRVRRTPRALVIVGLLMVYVYITNQRAPVMRASVMAAVLLLGNTLERRVDVFNSIAFAALIVLMINPLDLFEAGFQLSFAAVLAILVLYNKFRYSFKNSLLRFREQGREWQTYVVTLFFVSFAAQLGTLPLTATYFQRIPIVSLVANLLVIPLVAVIVILGYVTTFFGLFWSGLAQIYANANWLVLHVLVTIVKWGAHLPFAYITQATPNGWFFILYYVCIFLFAFWGIRKIRFRLIIVILVLCNILVWQQTIASERRMTATFLDVGQGDSAFFQFPNGRTLLVDTGPLNDQFDAGKKVVVPFLKRQGVKQIDALVLTHAHSDHVGGALSVLRNIKVGRIIEAENLCCGDAETKLGNVTDSLNVPCQQVFAGDSIYLCPSTLISVFHPTPDIANYGLDESDGSNDMSVVLKIKYKQSEFLLSGDAEQKSEAEMLVFADFLKSDVLKVGHHGSDTSSSTWFLNKVDPEYAVISVGKHNRFRLPSKSVINRLKSRGVNVIRTDENGAVVFRTNGKVLERIR